MAPRLHRAQPGHGVYLFHADEPIGNLTNPRAMARHYIGYADELACRIAQQLAGNAHSAALMRAFINAGVGVELVRIWPGATRRFERQLKRLKNTPRRLCPICRSPTVARRLLAEEV
jgi:hypothetical protein